MEDKQSIERDASVEIKRCRVCGELGSDGYVMQGSSDSWECPICWKRHFEVKCQEYLQAEEDHRNNLT